MNLAPNEKPSNLIENLIEEGIVELKIYNTAPEHAKEYGLDSVNPLYVQSIYVSDNSRLKGIGKKVLAYIDKYAIKNGHDVIFGHITQKAKFTKDKRETFFSDIDMIKNWLHSNSYAINQNNNDFYKVVNTTFDSSSGDLIKNDCIEFIKNTESIINNGYYLDIKNLNVYVGAGDKTISKTNSLLLITYNSGGQSNLKAIDTINSLVLAQEICKLLNIDIHVARIIVSEQIKYSKPFSMSVLNDIKNKNIIIANRDRIEFTNIISNFENGGCIIEFNCEIG